jgi:putative SOS response-associated peptidase YedK
MCYRYSTPSPSALEKTFQAKIEGEYEQRYHVGAFDDIKLPVITNENPDKIYMFSWGLIPFWVKNQKQATEISQRTVNARAETIYEKPAFRNAAKNKHCLVLADGFFEWRHFLGKKYPYYIRLKSKEPFAMAGLWETWNNKSTNEEVNSYTIITTDANPLLAKIHNTKKRMPVILNQSDYNTWLDTNISKNDELRLLTAYDESNMDAYTISRLITSKEQNPNVPDVLEPYEYSDLDPLKKQTSLF